MGLKEFLMPDWRKIVIFFILFTIFCYITNNLFPGKGFPFAYLNLPEAGGMLPSGALVDYGPSENIINLVLDFVFWYLVSCLMIWAYDKLKKKPEKKKKK